MSERLKSKGVRTIVAASVLFIAGCSTIHENETIDDCAVPDGTFEEATTDPTMIGYNPETDPALLAARLYNQARETMENDTEGWDMVLRSQVVGIGEVACRGENGFIYLTEKGSAIHIKE